MPWYEYIARSLIIAVALVVLAHFMGRRIVAQMTTIDFVVGITVGSIAAVASLNPKVPLWAALLTLVTWTGSQWVYANLERRCPAFRSAVGETETVLVQNGEISPSGLDKAKISRQILLSELRAKQVTNLADVEMATMEPTGKIAVKLSPNRDGTGAARKDIFPEPK